MDRFSSVDYIGCFKDIHWNLQNKFFFLVKGEDNGEPDGFSACQDPDNFAWAVIVSLV